MSREGRRCTLPREEPALPDLRRTVRIAAFLPAAAVLVAALSRCWHEWSDARGYIAVGRDFLHGMYSRDPGNTWPPFFSLVAAPISLLGELPAPAGRFLWAALNSVVLALAVAHWWRAARPERVPVWVAPAAALLVAPFWAQHIMYQQVYALVFAAAALGFAEAERGREGRAGFWIGLAGSAKVTPAFALLYFAATRRWRAAGAAILTAIACSLATVPVLGPRGALEAHVRWVEQTAGLRGTHQVRNRSVLAFVERWSTDEPVGQGGARIPPIVSLSGQTADAIGRALSAALLLLSSWIVARRGLRPLHAFAVLAPCWVLAAPYCWMNQLVALFPLLLLTLANFAQRRDRWDWVLIAPFLLGTLLREPGLVGLRAFMMIEGAGLTTLTALLLIANALRRRGDPAGSPAVAGLAQRLPLASSAAPVAGGSPSPGSM